VLILLTYRLKLQVVLGQELHQTHGVRALIKTPALSHVEHVPEQSGLPVISCRSHFASAVLLMGDVFARKFKTTESAVEEAKAIVAQAVRVVTPAMQLNVIREDPDDDKTLECAVSEDRNTSSRVTSFLRLGRYDSRSEPELRHENSRMPLKSLCG
jgi:hypothetical protein